MLLNQRNIIMQGITLCIDSSFLGGKIGLELRPCFSVKSVQAFIGHKNTKVLNSNLKLLYQAIQKNMTIERGEGEKKSKISDRKVVKNEETADPIGVCM